MPIETLPVLVSHRHWQRELEDSYFEQYNTDTPPVASCVVEFAANHLRRHILARSHNTASERPVSRTVAPVQNSFRLRTAIFLLMLILASQDRIGKFRGTLRRPVLPSVDGIALDIQAKLCEQRVSMIIVERLIVGPVAVKGKAKI